MKFLLFMVVYLVLFGARADDDNTSHTSSENKNLADVACLEDPGACRPTTVSPRPDWQTGDKQDKNDIMNVIPSEAGATKELNKINTDVIQRER